jgi:hypothetical protein
VVRLREERAEPEEYGTWDLPIAINAGSYSGGVVCIDFDDGGSCFEEWKQLVEDTKPGTLQHLTIERTPSGGYHCIYRTTVDIKNIKLAQKSVQEEPDRGKSGLIETRGTGGYFVCAPSPGYVLIQGSIVEMCLASPNTHELLLSAARALNRFENVASQPKNLPPATGDLSPYDDYDSKNTPIDELVLAGWAVVKQRGEATILRRPGKDREISATWNYVPGRFWCFTTSTNFENEKPYKPSAVYAILHHFGKPNMWSAAASDLKAKGYGKKPEPQKVKDKEQPADKPEEKKKSRIITVESLRETMNSYRQFGANDRGVSTGWSGLDEHYRPAKGQFNVVTGIPGHGKSEFMDALMINVSSNSKWRWLVFSPENYPFERHIAKMIEKRLNDSFFKIDDESYLEAFNWVNKHFMFIDQTLDGTTLADILTETRGVMDEWHPDAIVVDPWNELSHTYDPRTPETNYIGQQISMARNFARKNDVAFFVIAHPAKMQKDKKTKKYDPPSPYDIAGSAHWYNKCDNALCVFRDFASNVTTVFIQKIKFKMYGKVGKLNFDYDKASGNYIEKEKDHMDAPEHYANKL